MASLNESMPAKFLRGSAWVAGVGVLGLATVEHGLTGTVFGGLVAAGLVWVSRELTKISDLKLK